MIGTDHSPAPMSMKTDPDFFKVWGGVASCQHLLTLLFDLGLEPELIARVTASQVARRFRLPPGKAGTIAAGADADLVLFDPAGKTPVTEDVAAIPPQADALPRAHVARSGPAHDPARPDGRPRRAARRRTCGAARHNHSSTFLT